MSKPSDQAKEAVKNFVRALARRAARLDDEAWELALKSTAGWNTGEPPVGTEIEFWKDGRDLDRGVLIGAGQGEVGPRGGSWGKLEAAIPKGRRR